MENHKTIDGGPLPIDLEHLSTYTAGDPAVTRDVLVIFTDQSGLWIKALHGAETLKDWQDTAHTIKGAARGVGAHELAHLAAEAEGLDAFDSPARTQYLSRIEDVILRAGRYAKQLVEDSPFVG